jgi:hypothetical protein
MTTIFLNTTSASCKRIESLLLRKSLLNTFKVEYVDIGNYVIPEYVGQIPTLLTADKKVIVGDDINRYLESFCQKQATKEQYETYLSSREKDDEYIKRYFGSANTSKR